MHQCWRASRHREPVKIGPKTWLNLRPLDQKIAFISKAKGGIARCDAPYRIRRGRDLCGQPFQHPLRNGARPLFPCGEIHGEIITQLNHKKSAGRAGSPLPAAAANLRHLRPRAARTECRALPQSDSAREMVGPWVDQSGSRHPSSIRMYPVGSCY